MKRETSKFILFVLFIIAAFFAARALGLQDYLDQRKLRLWIGGYGIWGPVVYILIYSIAPVFLLPGLPLTVIAGVLFGPFWGSLYVIIGANIAAQISFLIARYLGRDMVEGLIKAGGKIAELDRGAQRQGWKIVAFTRLIPIFPYNLQNYAWGLTSVRFIEYAAATFIFMIPGVIAYVVFSSSILDLLKGRISKEFLVGAILVIIISIIPLIYRKLKGI